MYGFSRAVLRIGLDQRKIDTYFDSNEFKFNVNGSEETKCGMNKEQIWIGT
jgi:hypothetical protein